MTLAVDWAVKPQHKKITQNLGNIIILSDLTAELQSITEIITFPMSWLAEGASRAAQEILILDSSDVRSADIGALH